MKTERCDIIRGHLAAAQRELKEEADETIERYRKDRARATYDEFNAIKTISSDVQSVKDAVSKREVPEGSGW